MSLISRRYLQRNIKRTNILHSINLRSDAGLCSVEYGLPLSLGSKLHVLRHVQSLSLLPWCTGLPGSPRSPLPWSQWLFHAMRHTWALKSALSSRIFYYWTLFIRAFCTFRRLLLRLLLWDQILSLLSHIWFCPVVFQHAPAEISSADYRQLSPCSFLGAARWCGSSHNHLVAVSSRTS